MDTRVLISTSELAERLGAADLRIVDCRFYLSDKQKGRHAYAESHIPGAVFGDLEEHLSGPIIPGQTGRHPLRDADELADVFGVWGIDEHTQVVAYDDMGGAIAARLWWMLRWLGHDQVVVLDGGWQGWLAETRPVSDRVMAPDRTVFKPNLQPDMVVAVDQVAQMVADPRMCVVDSRSTVRYRGEQEPIDPVAGHIPGAVNLPFAENLGADGRFLSQAQLRQRFEAVLGGRDPGSAVFYCGSGVTAGHNMIGMAHAGLGTGRIYPGSWSEWICDETRPIVPD